MYKKEPIGKAKSKSETSTTQQNDFERDETGDISSENKDLIVGSGYDLLSVEVIYCRTTESGLPEMTKKSRDIVKRKEDVLKGQIINCRRQKCCCAINNLGIEILENVSTIICMVYHVTLNDNEGKHKFKKREHSLLYSIMTEGYSKKVGELNLVNSLCRPSIFHRQNINIFPVSLNNYFDSLTSGSSMSLDESMSNNLLRIYSFSSFPRQVNIFTSLLAKAGFYYTGVSDEVRCYACGLSYKNWSSADKPLEIHRRLSPSCSHVIKLNLEHESVESNVYQNSASSSPSTCNTGVPSLLSLPNTDSTLHLNNLSNPSSEITRQNFPSLSENGSHISSSLSSHVLDTINSSSRSNLRERLPYSSVEETNASAVNPINTSANENRQSQRQNWSRNQSCNGASDTNYDKYNSNETSAVLNSSLDVNDDGAKYPNYGPIQIRISSFQGWPSYLDQTPHAMAKAGFLFAGYHDYTRCFFCGGGLRNWEAGDDPWIEHARWFPNCRYLKDNKGERFVKAVQDKQAQLNKDNSQTNGQYTTFQTSVASVNEEPSDARLQSSHETKQHLETVAAKSVLEMGYTEGQVQQAIQKITQLNNGETNISAVDILSKILYDDDGNTNRRQTDALVTTGNALNANTISSISGAAVNGSSSAVNGICDANVGLDDSKIDDAEQLVEENRQLKDQRLCKICLEFDASIAFLPCGHLVCCSDCAPAMRKCPICRALVKGTVKTFLV